MDFSEQCLTVKFYTKETIHNGYTEYIMKCFRYGVLDIYYESLEHASCMVVSTIVLGFFKANLFVIGPHLWLMYLPVTQSRLKIIQIKIFFL